MATTPSVPARPPQLRLSRRFEYGEPLLHDFLAHFPLPGDGPRTITVDEFDDWAASHGFFGSLSPSDTGGWALQRNVIRGTINAVASSEKWAAALYEPFHVKVGAYGKSYEIFLMSYGFASLAEAVPKKVESVVKTRRKQIATYRQALIASGAPYDVIAQAKSHMDRIDDFKERVALEANQLERRFKDFRAEQIAANDAQARLLADNSADEGEDDEDIIDADIDPDSLV